ncbi:hypothetical protein [Maricurvus nonylphenolicus]|uniref:hypothetical protein n=1 Tax=Maricurvus nonylphenolicus TaxID=1008307 RepID=UPI0036F1B990
MSQDGRKRISLYIIIVAMVIVLSSGLTVYITQSSSSQFSSGFSGTKRSSANNEDYKHYGIFAGYDVCKEAIINGANGQVMVIESDDRTAHYRGYNDTNVITFSAEVKPNAIPFLSEQRSTYHVSVRCATSAKDNQLVNLSWLTTDTYGVQ